MRRLARIDSTAHELVDAARAMGAKVLILNGVIDVLIYYRGALHMVDFKRWQGKKQPKVTLTPAQERLIADGWPLNLIADLDGLERLLRGEG